MAQPWSVQLHLSSFCGPKHSREKLYLHIYYEAYCIHFWQTLFLGSYTEDFTWMDIKILYNWQKIIFLLELNRI